MSELVTVKYSRTCKNCLLCTSDSSINVALVNKIFCSFQCGASHMYYLWTSDRDILRYLVYLRTSSHEETLPNNQQ